MPAAQEYSRGKDNLSWMGEELKKQLERFEKLCKDLGEKQSDVALAWLLQQEAVTAPIMGIRTLEQLESAVHALDIHLETDFFLKGIGQNLSRVCSCTGLLRVVICEG